MSKAGSLGGGAALLGESIRAALDFSRDDGKGTVVEHERAANVPVLTWAEFLAYFKWFQGEHITGIGTTGSGKTTLAIELLPRRKFVLAFGTKPRDDTLEKLLRQGYFRIQEWGEIPPEQISTKVLLWPKVKKAGEVKTVHKRIFKQALEGAFEDQGWAIFIDELRYITDFLGLSDEVEIIWQMGRSVHISLSAWTQRPRNVPLVAYDQATHLFFWRENDYENLQRMGGIAHVDKKQVIEIISNLPKHAFLYLNTRDGEMRISRVTI